MGETVPKNTDTHAFQPATVLSNFLFFLCLKLCYFSYYISQFVNMDRQRKGHFLSVSLFFSHYVKSAQIWNFIWSVFSCILTKYRKIRTRKNSAFGYFSHSAHILHFTLFASTLIEISFEVLFLNLGAFSAKNK